VGRDETGGDREDIVTEEVRTESVKRENWKGDDNEKVWDGRKSTVLSLTIWVIDAKAAQYGIHVDRVVPNYNMFGLRWSFDWNKKTKI
jgi:hypothetical protein